jgi:hypothetical protein
MTTQRKEAIEVQGTEITLLSNRKEDYISLTDMAKYKNAEATGYVISRWLSARYTLTFIGLWEKINNPNFNVVEFDNIRNESGNNSFVMTSKQWIEATNAI